MSGSRRAIIIATGGFTVFLLSRSSHIGSKRYQSISLTRLVAAYNAVRKVSPVNSRNISVHKLNERTFLDAASSDLLSNWSLVLVRPEVHDYFQRLPWCTWRPYRMLLHSPMAPQHSADVCQRRRCLHSIACVPLHHALHLPVCNRRSSWLFQVSAYRGGRGWIRPSTNQQSRNRRYYCRVSNPFIDSLLCLLIPEWNQRGQE